MRTVQDYVYDPEVAERPVRFIEGTCFLHKGRWAGQKLKLRMQCGNSQAGVFS